MKSIVSCTASLGLLLSAICQTRADDAAADFSLASNPNGSWSYGYSNTLAGPFNLYTISTSTTFANPNFSSWQAAHGADGTPLVVKNTASTNQQGFGANLDPGELALHPGPSGEFSIVRWTAPGVGVFALQATFEGRDNLNGTTTDVHILRNGVSLYDAEVNGFGPSSDEAFATVLSTLPGDQIDFVVGVGTDGSFLSDTTGLAATIEAPTVPEIDAGAIGSGLTILVGGVLSLRARRKRRI